MKHAKNQHTKSTRLHASRQRTNYTPPSRTRRIILSVILATFVLVAIAFAFSFLNAPEHRVKTTLSNLATDYYENYLHPTLDTTNPDMTRYEEHGFAPVTLRQLLLYDNQKNSAYSAELTEYCDENSTIISFYPNPPYTKTDYRTEYVYSCAF